MMSDIYLPSPAVILQKKQETNTVFTLSLKFVDQVKQQSFSFMPGKFNVLSLFGVGDVPMSIISDPIETDSFKHTIRAVGRITKALNRLSVGSEIGVRGAYGNGWPLEEVKGKHVTVISGGIGCAPVVSVIQYIQNRREHYGQLTIFQGIKHSKDMIFDEYFNRWRHIPNTEVCVAADKSESGWSWSTGRLVDLIKRTPINVDNHVVMMCGPEIMMKMVISDLLDRGFDEKNIFISTERNMACGIGHCGHCQMGEFFVCKDGPIFSYDNIKHVFKLTGF